jgi:tRNA U34 5-carboxymethylaminomethyl modifying GTPase MnmE/TrmE
VLDNNEPNRQLTASLIENLAGKKTLTILNKSDLPFVAQRRRDLLARFDPAKLPGDLASSVVRISALLGTGLDALAEKICETTGVANFDFAKPVCFTARQEQLLTKLTNVKSKDAAHSIITELLSGRLNV